MFESLRWMAIACCAVVVVVGCEAKQGGQEPTPPSTSPAVQQPIQVDDQAIARIKLRTNGDLEGLVGAKNLAPANEPVMAPVVDDEATLKAKLHGTALKLAKPIDAKPIALPKGGVQ